MSRAVRRQPPATSGSEKPQCPRCSSQDTRNCGYSSRKARNPKYFCKSCSRYWIHGGRRLNSRKKPAPTGSSPLPSRSDDLEPGDSSHPPLAPRPLIDPPITTAAAAAAEPIGANGLLSSEGFADEEARKTMEFLEWVGGFLDSSTRLDPVEGVIGGGDLHVPEDLKDLYRQLIRDPSPATPLDPRCVLF